MFLYPFDLYTACTAVLQSLKTAPGSCQSSTFAVFYTYLIGNLFVKA